MYSLISTARFINKAAEFKRKNVNNSKFLIKSLNLLSRDPFYPSLRTHKVNSRLSGESYSSRITGDIRIIWNFDNAQTLTLLLLDLGGHSGKDKVYN